jgi:hypothetical protein
MMNEQERLFYIGHFFAKYMNMYSEHLSNPSYYNKRDERAYAVEGINAEFTENFQEPPLTESELKVVDSCLKIADENLARLEEEEKRKSGTESSGNL